MQQELKAIDNKKNGDQISNLVASLQSEWLETDRILLILY